MQKTAYLYVFYAKSAIPKNFFTLIRVGPVSVEGVYRFEKFFQPIRRSADPAEGASPTVFLFRSSICLFVPFRPSFRAVLFRFARLFVPFCSVSPVFSCRFVPFRLSFRAVLLRFAWKKFFERLPNHIRYRVGGPAGSLRGACVENTQIAPSFPVATIPRNCCLCNILAFCCLCNNLAKWPFCCFKLLAYFPPVSLAFCPYTLLYIGISVKTSVKRCKTGILWYFVALCQKGDFAYILAFWRFGYQNVSVLAFWLTKCKCFGVLAIKM